MLMLFFGNDRLAVRDAAQTQAETTGGTVTVIDDLTYTGGLIANALGANSLFGGQECFILDTPSSLSEFEEETMTHLSDMAASPNTFLVLEGPLLVDARRRYAKHALDSREFSSEKAERFNTFAMAEALAKRDKKTLWVLLNQARSAGLRDEEIIGMLWWQLKALRLAKITKSAVEAGMKDFPYNKAKRALSGFKESEIEALSHSLLELYHHAHQGTKDMDLALEEWVLKV